MVPITSNDMGRVLNTISVLGVVVLTAAAVGCGSDASDGAESAAAPNSDDVGGSGQRPQIVVTTSILGDVVAEAVGDQADIEVIMPLGSDPHDFSPSARQAESMENADLLVVNGAGFEEGMLDTIANVSDSGTDVFSFADQVDLLDLSGEHTDEHADQEGEHSDEEEEHAEDDSEHAGEEDEEHAEDEGEHADEEEHADDEHEGGGDPHIWTDPTRISTAVTALEPVVAELDGIDADALAATVAGALDGLADLDTSMEQTLASVPDDRRVLVTNHEVFGYFADRFDFEVVGAIIPSLTTNAEPSASDFDDLADVIEAEGIRAIFAETTQSSRLADVLADEVGDDVEVVELFTESLGEAGSGAETYIEMMQLDAERIAGALSS